MTMGKKKTMGKKISFKMLAAIGRFSKNFDQKIYNHIASSSPLYFQQIAIPDEEYIRLISKFKKVELENFINPDIIVLENSMPLTKKVFLNEKYCKSFQGKFFILFFKRKPEAKCK